MAQSKREQINLVGQAPAQDEQNTVPDLLLQQHRWNLTRTLVSRLADRALFILNVGGLALVGRLSLIHLLAAISTALLLAYRWYYETGLLSLRLKALEETLAKRSGEVWEDIYIQTAYRISSHRTKFGAYVPEPVVWAALVIALGLLRFFLERR